MADENYAIKVQFDGINDAIGDIDKLQAAVANIKAPVFNFGGDEASKLAEASLKKIQLEIDALEEKKAKSAANDLLRAEQLAAKQEQSAQRDAQRDADATARKEANAQKILDQLEKQFATANVRVTQGGNEGPDKEAKFTAQTLQEALRYKQQLAAIDKAGFSAADAENAKQLAAGINSLNLQKIEKEFEKVNTGQRNFTGNLKDSAELLGIAAQKVKQFQENASAAYAEQRKSQGALSTQADDAKGLTTALKGLAVELKNQVSTADLTANAAQVAQQGYRGTKENIDVLRASQKLAISEQIDFNQALGLTSTVLKAYNLPASEAANVTDQLVATARAAKVPVGELGSQYDKLASTAAGTGTKFEQLNSFIANASAKGITAKTSVGALNQALENLQSGDFVKKAQGLGIVLDEQKIKSGGLEEALKQLKAQGIDQNSVALNTLFGSAKNVSAILPSLENGLGTVADASGVVNKNFETQSGFNRAAASANQLKDALAEVGAAIAPFTLAVTNTLRAASAGFAQLDPSIKTVIGTLAGLVGAGFAVSAVITGTLAVITPTIGAFKILAGAITEKTIAENASVAATTRSTAATVSQGIAQTATAIKTKASAVATGLYSLATTKITGDLILANAQLAIKNVQLGLVAAKTAIATGATALYSGATNVLTGSLTAATGAASALIIPLGLAAAAAGVLFAQIKANQISESLDALNATGVGVKTFGDEAIRSATKAQTFSNQLKSLTADGKKASEQQITDAKNLVKANEERLKAIADQEAKVKNGGAIDETKGTREAQLLDLKQSQSALSGQNEILKEQIKLNETNASASAKFGKATQVNTEELKKQAIALKETQNQDAEKSIKRTFDDAKAKQDRENAKAIAAIEEQNALKKGELDRKQALETEALKERQALALQDKQKAFEDTQNAKKQAAEQALESRKQSFEAKQQSEKQAFEDRLNSEKEARAEKQRKADEAFALARAEREKKASEAQTGAKQLISDEGAIATAKPEDRAKLAAQLAEENRIRTQAAQQGQGGVQSQEQLVAQAKQLAQVSAIATKEEQAKVQLALDELEKANKAKQAELDKAEDAKRAEAKRVSDKAFEAELNASKLAFDAEQNTAKLNFENSVLKPEKQKIEAELQASKLAFERGELATLKKQQAAEERALQLQQNNEDLALKKAADAELEALKIKQKDAELAKDRAFEDAKIERERAFKESQRALDKASAIEIQQILGKSAQQIIDAIATAKGGTALSSAIGAGTAVKPPVPAFSEGVQNFRGGMALVGEQGAELVTLPRGSNVLPAPQTKSLINNNSGGNKTYNINVTTTGSDPIAIAQQIQREQASFEALRSGI
jgi:hypothetical protein